MCYWGGAYCSCNVDGSLSHCIVKLVSGKLLSLGIIWSGGQ